MKTTIENEEGVPIDFVTNMDEVRTMINLFHISSQTISCKMLFYNVISTWTFPKYFAKMSIGNVISVIKE